MIGQRLVRFGGCLFSAAGLLLYSSTLVCAAQASGAGNGRPPPSAAKRRPHLALIGEVLQQNQPAADRDVDPERAAEEAAAKAEILGSDAMLQAEVWLDEYFAVQVDYDQQEVARFKTRLQQMSSSELRSFLVRFQRQRELIRQRHQASERLRAQRITLNREAIQRQQSARKSAAGAHRYGRYGGYSHHQKRVTPRRRDVIRPPLVSSLSVARYAAYRAVFGGRW